MDKSDPGSAVVGRGWRIEELGPIASFFFERLLPPAKMLRRTGQIQAGRGGRLMELGVHAGERGRVNGTAG
jgi:hypothetical protein